MQRIASASRIRGFTLIELMIVVAVIGILSSIAIPSYRDYVVKAKLTEALVALGPVKLAVMEYYMINGSFAGLAGKSWSAILKELGIASNYFGENSKYVYNVWWNNTHQQIRVSFPEEFSEVHEKHLVLQADISGGVIRWRCLSDQSYDPGVPAEYLPNSCY